MTCNNVTTIYCDQVSLVAALEDGVLEVFTRPGLQRLRSLRGPGERLTTMDMDTRVIVTGDDLTFTLILALSQEESKVLGISGSLDGSVRLWCRSQHRALVTISPHNAPVTAIIIDKPLDVKVDSKEFIVTSASYLRVGWSGSTCSQPPGTALSGEWGWWLPGRGRGRVYSSSGNVSQAKL